MEIKEKLPVKTRPEIHTLCLGDEAWEQARELAKDANRSISSFFRSTVNNLYRRKKKQQELSSS